MSRAGQRAGGGQPALGEFRTETAALLVADPRAPLFLYVLVALNAVFQVLLYSVLGFFYLQVLPGWLALGTASLHVSIAAIAGTVAVFLGIPLAAGYLSRTLGERFRGREWYESRFLPRIAPVALYGLLFTVVILFASAGRGRSPPSRWPWSGSRCRCWPTSRSCGSPGSRSAAVCACPTRAPRAVSFSAAEQRSPNWRFAVAIGVFGVTSGQALAEGRRSARLSRCRSCSGSSTSPGWAPPAPPLRRAGGCPGAEPLRLRRTRRPGLRRGHLR